MHQNQKAYDDIPKVMNMRHIASYRAGILLCLVRITPGALLRPVVVDDLTLDGLVKYIDLRRGKFAGADSPFEEQIQLREGTSTRLRHAEVGVNNAQETDTAPEEACVVAPVPGAGIQHIRGEDTADNSDDVV